MIASINRAIYLEEGNLSAHFRSKKFSLPRPCRKSSAVAERSVIQGYQQCLHLLTMLTKIATSFCFIRKQPDAARPSRMLTGKGVVKILQRLSGNQAKINGGSALRAANLNHLWEGLDTLLVRQKFLNPSVGVGFAMLSGRRHRTAAESVVIDLPRGRLSGTIGAEQVGRVLTSRRGPPTIARCANCSPKPHPEELPRLPSSLNFDERNYPQTPSSLLEAIPRTEARARERRDDGGKEGGEEEEKNREEKERKRRKRIERKRKCKKAR